MQIAWLCSMLAGLALAASACSSKESPQSIGSQAPAAAAVQAPPAGAIVANPAAPQAAIAFATDGQGQCYIRKRKIDGEEYWLHAGDLASVAACFSEDECYGSTDPTKTRCTKWALSAESPPLAWPAALTHVPPGQCYYNGRDENADPDNSAPTPWRLQSDVTYRQCRSSDSCNGGLGLWSNGTLQCHKWATGPDALGAQYQTGSTPNASSVVDRGKSGWPACYWFRESTQAWEPVELYTEVACFRFDSCTGGSARSGGGCYKWAEGRDAKASPWRGLKPAVGKPTPLVDGLFDLPNACPFEGCGLGDWRAFAPVQLLADSSRNAPVIATVPNGEWVSVVQSIDRKRPLRGVAVMDGDYVYKGDEVWLLGYEGEGYEAVWRAGEIVSDQGAIQWDEGTDTAVPEPRAGWWAQVRRANGQTGWVLDGGGFRCIGAIDPPPECEERIAAPQ